MPSASVTVHGTREFIYWSDSRSVIAHPASISEPMSKPHPRSSKFARKIVCCHHYQKQALTELPSALELCLKLRAAGSESAVIAREFD